MCGLTPASLPNLPCSRASENHGDTHAHSVRAGRIFRTTGEDFIRRVDVGEALGSGLRDGRGRNVIEEAVIFIVRKKEAALESKGSVPGLDVRRATELGDAGTASNRVGQFRWCNQANGARSPQLMGFHPLPGQQGRHAKQYFPHPFDQRQRECDVTAHAGQTG